MSAYSSPEPQHTDWQMQVWTPYDYQQQGLINQENAANIRESVIAQLSTYFASGADHLSMQEQVGTVEEKLNWLKFATEEAYNKLKLELTAGAAQNDAVSTTINSLAASITAEFIRVNGEMQYVKAEHARSASWFLTFVKDNLERITSDNLTAVTLSNLHTSSRFNTINNTIVDTSTNTRERMDAMDASSSFLQRDVSKQRVDISNIIRSMDASKCEFEAIEVLSSQSKAEIQKLSAKLKSLEKSHEELSARVEEDAIEAVQVAIDKVRDDLKSHENTLKHLAARKANHSQLAAFMTIEAHSIATNEFMKSVNEAVNSHMIAHFVGRSEADSMNSSMKTMTTKLKTLSNSISGLEKRVADLEAQNVKLMTDNKTMNAALQKADRDLSAAVGQANENLMAAMSDTDRRVATAVERAVSESQLQRTSESPQASYYLHSPHMSPIQPQNNANTAAFQSSFSPAVASEGHIAEFAKVMNLAKNVNRLKTNDQTSTKALFPDNFEEVMALPRVYACPVEHTAGNKLAAPVGMMVQIIERTASLMATWVKTDKLSETVEKKKESLRLKCLYKDKKAGMEPVFWDLLQKGDAQEVAEVTAILQLCTTPAEQTKFSALMLRARHGEEIMRADLKTFVSQAERKTELIFAAVEDRVMMRNPPLNF